MENIVYSKAEQIKNTTTQFGHLVILGAGASKASCIDNPEKRGKVIPLMDDLPKVVDINKYLYDLPRDVKDQDFEQLFSYLHSKEGNSQRIQKIESAIYEFFKSLELPDTPTVYDYLILSLRKKDMIATFNWDPFLVQAYHRNAVFTKNLPQLVFLHGNVAVGYDNKTHRSSYIINESENSKDLLPTKLLYPIEKKDYNSNGFIKNQWEKLLDYLNKANLITVFGYSAPVTDIEARNLMIKVWGTPEIDRYMEEIEIIDIDNEIKVAEKWSNFIFSHHYSHKQSLLHEDSWLYNFPRRTGEIYKVKYYDGLYQEDNRPSKFTSLVEMWDWFSELIKYEND